MTRVIPSIKRIIPSNIVIFCIMAMIFFILISMNFHGTIIADFFNSLQGKYGSSLMVIFVIVVVLIYALKFILSDWGLLQLVLPLSIIGMLIFFLIFVIYIIFTISICIPLAVFLIFTYLLVYTFFAIPLYKGFNFGTTLTMISEHISHLNEIIGKSKRDDGDKCDESKSSFEWKKIPLYIYRFFDRAIRYFYVYLFEILIVLTLLGGIVKYVKGYNTAIFEKPVSDSYNFSGSIKLAFNNLYTWLILINIIIIVLVVVLGLIKFNQFRNITARVDEKHFNLVVKEESGADGYNSDYGNDYSQDNNVEQENKATDLYPEMAPITPVSK